MNSLLIFHGCVSAYCSKNLVFIDLFERRNINKSVQTISKCRQHYMFMKVAPVLLSFCLFIQENNLSMA